MKILETGIEKGIAAAIVVVIGLMIVAIWLQSKEQAAFMAQCVEDHKPYECQAMWKQMHPDVQSVIVWAPLNR